MHVLLKDKKRSTHTDKHKRWCLFCWSQDLPSDVYPLMMNEKIVRNILKNLTAHIQCDDLKLMATAGITCQHVFKRHLEVVTHIHTVYIYILFAVCYSNPSHVQHPQKHGTLGTFRVLTRLDRDIFDSFGLSVQHFASSVDGQLAQQATCAPPAWPVKENILKNVSLVFLQNDAKAVKQCFSCVYLF